MPGIRWSALLLALVLVGSASTADTRPEDYYGLPLPSSMPLQDYEQKLYRWLFAGKYRDLQQESRWAVDQEVRDTGPFIDGISYGIHPAVRVYYSPGVKSWVEGGRKKAGSSGCPDGAIADGEIIVKEMFTPPAAIYREIIAASSKVQEASSSEQKEKWIAELLGGLVTSWAVMVKDCGASNDGWFWSSPGAPKPGQTISEAVSANLDSGTSVYTSGFGLYTCMRCHASAAGESTFSAEKNIQGDGLAFRVDSSWRTEAHTKEILEKVSSFLTPDERTGLEKRFYLPDQLRPYLQQAVDYLHSHAPPAPSSPEADADPLLRPNPDFVSMFHELEVPRPEEILSFPSQWSDHVYPGPGGPGSTTDGPYQYFTSDTCVGCHGGLAGTPYAVTMFVKTGPQYGNGYNVSEYGEWRWSPMGLAGRDPIFHSQIETEMIRLIQDTQLGKENPIKGDPEDAMHAVLNACLSCHGAMGQRQLSLDAAHDGELDGNMSTDYFYLTERLSSVEEAPSPPPHSVSVPAGGDPDHPPEPLPSFDYAGDPEAYQGYHRYGELAREGISCMICHHIAPQTEGQVHDWIDGLNPKWVTDRTPRVRGLAYFLFNNNTGRFESSDGDTLYGPFEDVATLPMENAFGITPKQPEPAYGGEKPFIQDSQMCGTCHTINLPNLGATKDPNPILSASALPGLEGYSYSIEQATFLEWQNSAFGPGVDGKWTDQFQSCQECHMPTGLDLPGELEIDPLVTQIATIQDQTYPAVDNLAPVDEVTVPMRDDYRRHELVGLNAFLVEMANQFPQILGVDLTDYETSATTGSELALKSMLRQARERTVRLKLADGEQPVYDPTTQTLEATVTVTNLTGHRFPSGVAFRRAFLEFAVLLDDDVIWVSGATNGAGVIVGRDRNPLPTELLDHKPHVNEIALHQPHYQKITRQDQVQIYEELILDGPPPQGEFTTSFIHRVYPVKDNRLLPQGWRPSEDFRSQGELMVEFMAATDPEGISVNCVVDGEKQSTYRDGRKCIPDPNYVDENIGSDTLRYEIDFSKLDPNPLAGFEKPNLRVRVTAYSQSLMPAWFRERFSLAAWAKQQGYATPETDRLYYLSSHLDLSGTAMADWKLPLVSTSEAVKVEKAPAGGY